MAKTVKHRSPRSAQRMKVIGATEREGRGECFALMPTLALSRWIFFIGLYVNAQCTAEQFIVQVSSQLCLSVCQCLYVGVGMHTYPIATPNFPFFSPLFHPELSKPTQNKISQILCPFLQAAVFFVRSRCLCFSKSVRISTQSTK